MIVFLLSRRLWMGTLIHFVYFCTQCEATAGGEWSILTTFTELYPKRK